MEGFALALALKQRQNATQKSPIGTSLVWEFASISSSENSRKTKWRNRNLESFLIQNYEFLLFVAPKKWCLSHLTLLHIFSWVMRVPGCRQAHCHLCLHLRGHRWNNSLDFVSTEKEKAINLGQYTGSGTSNGAPTTRIVTGRDAHTSETYRNKIQKIKTKCQVNLEEGKIYEELGVYNDKSNLFLPEETCKQNGNGNKHALSFSCINHLGSTTRFTQHTIITQAKQQFIDSTQ